MRKAIVATVAFLFALLPVSFVRTDATPGVADVGVALEPARDSTNMLLAVWSSGPLPSFDASTVRFVARPHSAPLRTERPLRITLGSYSSDPIVDARTRALSNFTSSVAFPKRPGGADVYDVRVLGIPRGSYEFALSWPHDENADAMLARLRTRLIGRDVYAFGGTRIACTPGRLDAYDAATPLRVRAVERQRGAVWLAAGREPYPGFFDAPSKFVALDPVRITFEVPHRAPVQSDGDVHAGIPGSYPALVLADWQIEYAFSLAPPPAAFANLHHALRLGMTRDAVVWSRGYPTEFGRRATLRAETTWSFDGTIVTFEHERVSQILGGGKV